MLSFLLQSLCYRRRLLRGALRESFREPRVSWSMASLVCHALQVLILQSSGVGTRPDLKEDLRHPQPLRLIEFWLALLAGALLLFQGHSAGGAIQVVGFVARWPVFLGLLAIKLHSGSSCLREQMDILATRVWKATQAVWDSPSSIVGVIFKLYEVGLFKLGVICCLVVKGVVRRALTLDLTPESEESFLSRRASDKYSLALMKVRMGSALCSGDFNALSAFPSAFLSLSCFEQWSVV